MRFGLVLLSSLLFLGACGKEESHPNIDRSHVGYVMSVDWSPRMFTLQDDKTNVLISLKSCGGQMPWPGEHIRINYHVYFDNFSKGYSSGCQIFDWMERVGPDLPIISCSTQEHKR